MCLDLVPNCAPGRQAMPGLVPLPPGVSAAEAAFGAPLASASAAARGVPSIVLHLIAAIDARGLSVPNLYVAPPDPRTAKSLREASLSKPDARALGAHDPLALAWLLRRYFFELPQPLIPTATCDKMIRSSPPAANTLDKICAEIPEMNKVRACLYTCALLVF